MAKLNINIGRTANDKSGDPLRTAFGKINANFTELYAGGASESQLTNGAYTLALGSTGVLTFPNNYTFTGQTLTDTSGTTNYSLKIANGTTGSVFGIGTGNEAFGIANDSLDHTGTAYVPYNATASTMSFNVPARTGSLTIDTTGVVTVPNGLVTSGLTFSGKTTLTTNYTVTNNIDWALTITGGPTGTNYGAGILIQGGACTGPQVGGNVVIQGGANTNGGGGTVDLSGGVGNSFNGSVTIGISSNTASVYIGHLFSPTTISGNVSIPNSLVIPTGTKASNATGTTGQISYDASYIYICTATNTWKRAALTGGY